MIATAKPVDAVIYVADAGAAAGLTDRIAGGRRVRADGFDATHGTLAGQAVVVAAPAPGVSASPEDACRRIILALAAAHQPERIIGAGWSLAVSDTPAGGPLFATEVCSRDGMTLRLCPADAATEGMRAGRLICGGSAGSDSAGSDSARPAAAKPAEDSAARGQRAIGVAAGAWAWALAQACAECGRPAAVVTLMLSEWPGTPEVQRIAQQRGRPLAWRAGALLWAVWRRPSIMADGANAATQHWRRQAALADAVQGVLRTPPATLPPQPGGR
ncbi:MAG: hypothetical protein AAF790_07430 [Planctomycetota bacterium]